MSDPYALLEEYARRGQELASTEQLEELGELASRFDALAASLPHVPPEHARPSLEAAERALASNVAQLEARIAAVREELARLGRGRRTRATYFGTTPASTVDTQG